MKTSYKTIAFTLLFTFVTEIFAKGKVVSDGGADPLLTHAKQHAKPAQLARAEQMIATAFARMPSEYDPLKDKVFSELNLLRSTKKIVTLPALIILGNYKDSEAENDDEEEGYDKPANENDFYALGAWTRFKIGAPIVFAERTLDYGDAQVAEILLHEILHHVLPKGSMRNEVFLKDVTTAILSGRVSSAHRAGLLFGLVVRNQLVSRRSIVHWMLPNLEDTAVLGYKSFPFDLSDLTVLDVISSSLFGNCSSVGNRSPSNCGESPQARENWQKTRNRLFYLAKLVDPSNPLANPESYDTMFCKHKVTQESWLAGDRCQDNMLLMKDLFDFRRLN